MTMRCSLGTTFIIFYVLFFISSALAADDAVDHKPPNITNGKLLINQDEYFILECQGTQPLHWKYKYQDEMIVLTGEDKEPNLDGYTYRSTLYVTEHHYHGHYFCYYEGSELNDSSQSTDIFVYLYGSDRGFAVLPEASYNLDVENEKIEVGEGDSLVLDCRPTTPELNVTVKFDGKVMHDGPLPNPQMGYVIEKITPDKLGNYTCHIDDEEKKFNVVAPRKYQQPYVILAPNSFPVVGYRVDIRCVLFDDDYDTRPEFSWICQSGHSCIGGGNNRKVNTSIESIDENSERRRFINTLTLSNVSLADSGNFTCQISGQDYESSHKTLSFIVEENREPFTNVTPKVDNITCNLGENVTWTLVIGSFPPPVLKAHERFRINYKHNGDTTLTMTNVQPSDFNQYVLEINNNLTSTNATLNLKVNRETRLEGIGGVNETVLLNSTIVAVCNASGYPLEDIKWKHQFCPGRKCSGDFQEIKNGSVTVIVDKENMKSSQYTFVATDIANIECSSKMLKENKTIAVADIEKKHVFKYRLNDDVWHEVSLKKTSQTVIQTYPLSLMCAASKYYFTNLTLEFDLKNREQSEGILQIIDNSTEFTFIKKLIIANISETESGIYKCKAWEKKQPPTAARIPKLDVSVQEFKPVFFTNESNMKVGRNSITKLAKEAFTFNCLVDGTPPVHITWMKNRKPLSDDFGEISRNRKVIKISDLKIEKHEGHYECKASNKGSSITGSLDLFVEAESLSTGAKVTLWIVLIGILVLVIVVLWLARRVRRDFLKRREAKKNTQFLFVKGRPNELNPDCTADEQAELLPYDLKWEIPRDKIHIGQQIGSGAFGRVVKAVVSDLKPGLSSTTVALKMCKAQDDASQVRALTLELKIMLHLGKHLNIVNLIGAHTSRVNKGELWILVEFCKYGSLLSFVHRHRAAFVSVIDPITGLINFSNTDGKNQSPFSPVPSGSVRLSKSPPISPTGKVPLSPAHPAYEACVFGQTESPEIAIRTQDSGPPRVFNFDNTPKLAESLTRGMSMVPNPAYSMVPISEESSSDVFEDSKGSFKKFGRKRSLMAQDSHGNFFMYDKSSIPGVTSTFTTVDLLCWAWQIAEGMDYLSRRKVLHGDLALRNLLLAQDNVIKISDFGLSRQVYKDDAYFKKTNELMPVKWMSIEAIRDRIFTVQSDVWGFGITLWELFTLGSTPYPGVKVDHTFIQTLEEGYRMDTPKYANTDIYRLISACWFDHPDDRPDFRTLANELSEMLMPETTKHYNDKNDEYLNFNEERFKNEPDYLEMLSSPQYKEFCNKEDIQRESTDSTDMAPRDSTRKELIIEDNSGYLPMASAGSPTPSFNVFSPTRISEDPVFKFNKADNPEGDDKHCSKNQNELANRNDSYLSPSKTSQSYDESIGTPNSKPAMDYQNIPKESDVLLPADNADDEDVKQKTLVKDAEIISVKEGNYLNFPLSADTKSPVNPVSKEQSIGASYMNHQTVR